MEQLMVDVTKVEFTPEEIEKVKAAIQAGKASMRDWNQCRSISFERMNTPLDAPIRLKERQRYR